MANPQPQSLMANPQPQPQIANPQPQPQIADPQPQPQIANPQPQLQMSVDSTTKLKNVNKKADTLAIQKYVKNVAKDISNEVLTVAISKALTSSEFTTELMHDAIRKAVRNSELQQKYPPLPDSIQKLAEPTTATYIALYNKHRNVLKPRAVGCVEEKIVGYLERIKELSTQDQLERKEENRRRKERKIEARKKLKELEYTNFCVEKSDQIFEMFLDKFTDFLKKEKEIPKPLILGPNSLKLFQHIQGQITKLIGPKTVQDPAKDAKDAKATAKLRAGKTAESKKAVGVVDANNVVNQKQPLQTKQVQEVVDTMNAVDQKQVPEAKKDADTKVVDAKNVKQAPVAKKDTTVDNTNKSNNRKNIPDAAQASNIATPTDKLVTGTDKSEESKETAETREIVDTLSYYLLEFVQNSLVEAV